MKYSYRQISIHLIGCLFLLSIPIFTSPDYHSGLQLLRVRPFQLSFLRFILLLLFFYANYYVFIPRFYFNRKRILFLALLVISYVLIQFLPTVLIPDALPPPPPHGNPPDFGKGSPPFLLFDGNSVIPFLFVLCLSFLLKDQPSVISIYE